MESNKYNVVMTNSNTMKKTQKGILSLVLIALLFPAINNCKKEEPNKEPGNISLTTPANNAQNVALSEKLSWQAVVDPDGDAVVYDVYFGTVATPATITSAGQAGTTYAPTLSANTAYYWKVAARDPDGGTSESSIWSFTTLNNGPGATILSAPANAMQNVTLDALLTWQAVTDPDGDAVTYDVYFGTENIPVTIVSTNQAGNTYTPSLSAHTTYYWKVVAKDPNGGTSQSATWSFSTLNNSPGAVTLTSPADMESGVVLDAKLTWQAAADPDGDVVTYDVYFGTDAIPSTVAGSAQSATEFSPALSIGATYYWKVVAKDPYGGLSESAIWSFTAKIQIGDFYEGGVVFYLDETGRHGFVCPIFDTSPVLPALHSGWGCSHIDLNGAAGTAIGTGAQNTLDILAGCATEGTAADMCAKLNLNGYSDWFLPSLDELGEMRKNRDIINTYALANGGTAFTQAYYYSSSEIDYFYVYALGFYTYGSSFMVGKQNLNYPFRAIRAF